MNDKQLEQEIQDKGLNAPRVTLADLEANITDVEIVKHVSKTGKVLRWAVITTKNGFAVTGKPSASVSVENDNAETGEKVAIENAKSELWPLMGYHLASELAGTKEVKWDPLYGHPSHRFAPDSSFGGEICRGCGAPRGGRKAVNPCKNPGT